MRDADFTGELLGEDIDVGEHFVAQAQATEKFSIEEQTKKSHRNKIKQMYKFWETQCPKYYKVGVRDLTNEKLENSTKFYWRNKKILSMMGEMLSL